MIDVDRQVSCWSDGAHEDMEVARELVDLGRIRHGLFFAYLSLEKILKAHVCQYTNDLAPRIHNLVRLAELPQMYIDDRHLDVLAEMSDFNVEGYYPDTPPPPPTLAQAQMYIVRAEEALEWFTRKLLMSSNSI